MFQRKQGYAGVAGERVSQWNGIQQHFQRRISESRNESNKGRTGHDFHCTYYYYYYYYYYCTTV